MTETVQGQPATEQSGFSIPSPADYAGMSIDEKGDMLEQILGGATEQPKAETEPVKNINDKQPGNAEQPAIAPAQQTQNGQQQTTEKPAEVDFDAASKKAFYGENGEFDSTKFNDQFVQRKGFFKYELPAAPQGAEQAAQVEQPKTPEQVEQEYRQSYQTMMLGGLARVQELVGLGYTPEQAISIAKQEHEQVVSEHFRTRDFETDREKWRREMDADRQALQTEKQKAISTKNYSEVAQQYNGLIPGVSGSDALSQFVLNPKYGGEYVKAQFFRETPDALKMNDAQRAETFSNWLGKVQGDKQYLQSFAEIGYLRWMRDQLPGMVDYVKKQVATGQQNVAETFVQRPSQITKQHSGGTPSKIESFFGGNPFDTVI